MACYPKLLLALITLPFFAGLTLAQTTSAIAILWTNQINGTQTGTVTFTQSTGGGPVTITGQIQGLTPNSLRGMHVHQFGNLNQGCASTGIHFNPSNMNHGGPNSTQRHAGDLGNVITDGGGVANLNFADSGISLVAGQTSIIGRALVIHAKQDDLGLGNNTDSLTTGNAGERIACGVVAISS